MTNHDDPHDADARARRLAAEALAVDDPTGWFERLYVAADAGRATVPWDRGEPHPLLVEWADALDGGGRRAAVVGCGLGADAEYIASRGFETLAFDIAGSAVRAARRRFPGSRVDYVAADLLDPPADWPGAFDLVFESLTVQSLPVALHRAAIGEDGRLVAPRGTLVVVAAARDAEEAAGVGPPWPLTREEIDSFATGAFRPVRIERLPVPGQPTELRWRAEFRRDDSEVR